MKHASLLAAIAVVCGMTGHAAATRVDRCDDCRVARVWPTTNAAFPETESLRRDRADALDLGFAFSGGGTRSASATTGQLRALAYNGWITKARYIAAVSGGSWASIPYTYTVLDDLDLLGPIVPPEELDYDGLVNCADGRIAKAGGASGLPVASLREAVWRLSAPAFQKDTGATMGFLKTGLSSLLSRREGDREEKTFARVIGDTFIDPIVDPAAGQASRRAFAWDDDSVSGIVADNPGTLSHIQFLTTSAARRPFLIVGGTVASTRPIYDYPLLMPIELTPMYAGIRHAFGRKYGGTYIASWAYDRRPEGPSDGKTLTVHQGASDRNFTIADMAAVAGSAPELALLLGQKLSSLPSWAQAFSGSLAGFFPSLTHVTIRDGGVVVSGPTPHGDGGFTDNFGLMPLLARGVKNIIVFANVNGEYDTNDDIASYFERVPDPGFTGNKSLNVVFEPRGYGAMKKAFAKDVETGKPLVFCDRGWKVMANETYEIAPYTLDGICWVYLHAVEDWSSRVKRRDPRFVELLKKKKYSTFPWYDTFKQLKLDVPQVNLLANLESWIMTDRGVVSTIRASIPALPDPPARPAPATPYRFTAKQCVAP